MNKAAFSVVAAGVVVLGLTFRLAALDLRPMHHDEANQAVRFGQLLETGEYRYDRSDHHGPTLYYLTLPVAWARGQATFVKGDQGLPFWLTWRQGFLATTEPLVEAAGLSAAAVDDVIRIRTGERGREALHYAGDIDEQAAAPAGKR
jgi:hypothetical protein